MLTIAKIEFVLQPFLYRKSVERLEVSSVVVIDKNDPIAGTRLAIMFKRIEAHFRVENDEKLRFLTKTRRTQVDSGHTNRAGHSKWWRGSMSFVYKLESYLYDTSPISAHQYTAHFCLKPTVMLFWCRRSLMK